MKVGRYVTLSAVTVTVASNFTTTELEKVYEILTVPTIDKFTVKAVSAETGTGMTAAGAATVNPYVQIGPTTQTTGYDGCWGVFPFFPSGTMVASDRSEGLFVLGPTYLQAAYLEGTITNSVTLLPIDFVETQILGHNQVDQTNLAGFYATGIATVGTYDVEYSKVGYFPQTISVNLVNGIITTQDVVLENKSLRSYAGRTKVEKNNNIDIFDS